MRTSGDGPGKGTYQIGADVDVEHGIFISISIGFVYVKSQQCNVTREDGARVSLRWMTRGRDPGVRDILTARYIMRCDRDRDGDVCWTTGMHICSCGTKL